MPQTYTTPGTAVIHELLDNEVIIANLESGIYYSIRHSGVPIWQLLMMQHSTEQIMLLCAPYYAQDEVSVAETVTAFINQLVAENLIVGTTTQNNSAPTETDLL